MTPLPALVLVLAAAAAVGSALAPVVATCLWSTTLGAGLLVASARFGWAGHRVIAFTLAICASAATGGGLGGLAEAYVWTPNGIDLVALEERVSAGELVRVGGVLRRDAFLTAAGGVTLDLEIRRVWWHGRWRPTSVGASLTVAGDQARAARGAWTRGRDLEAPVASLRRPLPYRNFGLSDAERALARRGIRTFGTIKGAALIVVSAGPFWEEWAARARRHVRDAVARHVRDPPAAAVVTAILIGDRSAMHADVTRRLQHAGVYHVVAISGGNVGIWLAVLVVAPRAAGLGGRLAVSWLIAGLLAFALVVEGGPSVARAVIVAATMMTARWWDVRAAGLQALAVAAGLQVLFDPLASHDAGFVLSFGAAGTLVWTFGGRGGRGGRRPLARRAWAALGSAVLATLAIELVLLPISARWFSVATAAGVLANVLAVPAMAVVQVAGLILVGAAGSWPWLGAVAGALATRAVGVLLGSSDVVSLAPWLVREVPPPTTGVLAVYYACLAGAVMAWSRERRRWAVSLASISLGCLSWIVTGGVEHSTPRPWTWDLAATWQRASWPAEPWLLVTVLDVGQGDATVLRFPSGRTWLVDAGGSLSEAFDVGERVTTRALWALGHRTLSRVLVTHAHPDHAGGVPAVLRRLGARELLVGVPVPGDPMCERLADAARLAGTRERRLATGESLADGPVRVDVLHPDVPDWERRRVRNDDSVVLWVRFGDVGILLTGDVGEPVERSWAARFAAAPLTIVKLAHHGSASSTGSVLLASVRPTLAIASVGRGNRFGHPAPAVVRRLDEAGVVLLRTDRDGAIQLATNGRVVLVRTASGMAGTLTSWMPRRAWWPATPLPSDRGSPPRVASRPRPGVTPWP